MLFDVLPDTKKYPFKKHAKLQIIRKWILVNIIGLPWPLNFIHWSKIEVKLLQQQCWKHEKVLSMTRIQKGEFYFITKEL